LEIESPRNMKSALEAAIQVLDASAIAGSDRRRSPIGMR
jgi:hypothetical protein